MGYEKTMADGTVCRTGPNCKRHRAAYGSRGMTSFLSTLKAKISPVKDDIVPTSPYSSQSIPDATLSSTKILRGINAEYTKRVDKDDESYPKVQSSKPAILAQLDEESRDYQRTMPDDLIGIMQHYVSSYEFVNNYLRTGEQGIRDYFSTYSNPEIFFPNMDASVAKYVEMAKERLRLMDEAFETYKRPEQNVRRLFRSELVPEGVSTEQYLAKYSPDAIVKNDSYTSTSIDSDYMLVMNSPHVNKKRIVVFEMLSREGIPVHKHDDFSGAVSYMEREVLLDRGSEFKVKAVTTRKFQSSYPNKKPDGSHGNEGIPSAEYVVVQMEQIN